MSEISSWALHHAGIIIVISLVGRARRMRAGTAECCRIYAG